MSTIDLIGNFTSDFSKQSLAVYVELAAGLRLIGYTEPESTVRFNREMIVFESGTPRVTIIQDYFRTGVEVDFTYKQVCDPNLLALMLTGELDTSGASYDYTFLGSNPGSIQTYEWRFVGETQDNRLFELVIRKGQIGAIGDMAFGGQEYVGQQVTVSALQDTGISDTGRDLAYFRVAKRTFS